MSCAENCKLLFIHSYKAWSGLFFVIVLQVALNLLGANYGLAFLSIENTSLRFFLVRHCVYFGNPSLSLSPPLCITLHECTGSRVRGVS